MLVATAGGDPPDVVGVYSSQVGPYSATQAIEPLDELTADGTITRETYKPYVWKICAPGDRLYAAASTPVTVALYWNKDHFREAGLDPEKPPRTMEELDGMAEKLIVRKENDIERMGFLPNEPGWWDYSWGIYWGNQLYDDKTGHFNIDTPQQRAAYTWYQSYPRRYNVKDMQTFASGFGQFNSPQNAFINNKVSMVSQGPFFARFIELNAPGFVGHYGVTFMPLPEAAHRPEGSVAAGDLDCWVVPRGARNKPAVLEFLRFASRQDMMEELCIAHAKPSPLTKVSADFFRRNPNPYINVFDKAMYAQHIFVMPQSPVWERVQQEIVTAANNMWRDPDGFPVDKTLAAVQKTADQYVQDYQYYEKKRERMEAAHAR
jgi:ABC-type glycerol-3-phosphate transport system substrate-binding protein